MFLGGPFLLLAKGTKSFRHSPRKLRIEKQVFVPKLALILEVWFEMAGCCFGVYQKLEMACTLLVKKLIEPAHKKERRCAVENGAPDPRQGAKKAYQMFASAGRETEPGNNFFSVM